MRHEYKFWEEFWKWLKEDSEKMKLPMRGAPTLRKYLERKYRQFEELRRVSP